MAILVSLVQFPSPEVAAQHGVKSAFVSVDVSDTQILTEIGQFVDSGKIHTYVSSVHPLADIREAHAQSESRTAGKIVLQVADL